MLNHIIKGFKAEMEKIALTRYAIEDFSDAGGDDQFLHRKAGGSTYASGNEYVPPSKDKKKYKKLKMKYSDREPFNHAGSIVDVGGLYDGNLDYQTSRTQQIDPPIREFK